MSPVERLVARMNRAGAGIPESYEFSRTHAGRLQREAGAWSWSIVWGHGGRVETVGGYVPVTELLRAPRLICVKDLWAVTVDSWRAPTPGAYGTHPSDIVWEEPEPSTQVDRRRGAARR